ncbi:MAG: SPOR domain-containing protein [Actinobacteria bacterium]|nr:SPOR domain-containing protein [Actinomycetota bacterium]
MAAGLAVLGAGAGALAYVASQDDPNAASGVTAPETSRVITVPTLPVPTTETDSSLPGGTTGTLPMDTTYTTPLPTDTTAPVPGDIYTETGPSGGQTTGAFPATTDPYPTDTSGSSDPGGTGGVSGDEWPPGTTGWTAIASSVRNESDARAAASRLRSQGHPGGVLFSTDHPPLRPGYWVVFSGTYDTRSEAMAQARALLPSWPGAYPRQVG